MRTGLFWRDNEVRRDLDSSISRAAAYYLRKYGTRPDLCFVHPSLLGGKAPRLEGIQILPSRGLQPDQLWIGAQE
jgi:hypothetical protein